MISRPAAVAGTWYPGRRGALDREVRACLDAAPHARPGAVRAILVPHAGIMFSGPIGACAYRALQPADYDTVVLVGPSHFQAFDGLAIFPDGVFETPLGPARVDDAVARALLTYPIVSERRSPHAREHSLEMQLPFLKTLMPETPIVPLLMGYQTRATILAAADAIGTALAGRRALLVGSTDLSHYFDAETAGTLDRRVISAVGAFDPDAFQTLFEQYPEGERGRYVACGGGPAIAVMRAARQLGATGAQVLRYGHSGDVSGDNGAVVGYMAAVMGAW
jgi:AmmeMemoRadiSam system protein B